MQYSKVPVIYVALTEPEEKALNVALNQISGDWDFYKRADDDELRQSATFAKMSRRLAGHARSAATERCCQWVYNGTKRDAVAKLSAG